MGNAIKKLFIVLHEDVRQESVEEVKIYDNDDLELDGTELYKDLGSGMPWEQSTRIREWLYYT